MRPFLGPLDTFRFTYLWTHPDPRLDRLQREVADLVTGAARDHEEAHLTFEKIKARAAAVREDRRPQPLPGRPAVRDKGRPPRLTEPWFC